MGGESCGPNGTAIWSRTETGVCLTRCVGLLLNGGLGNIATYRKMYTFEEPGERVIAIMTAGSLSITQIALSRWREAIDDPEANEATSIRKAPTMLKGATIFGSTLASVRSEVDERLSAMNQGATASMIVAGQRRGEAIRLLLIYPQGNFIEATEDTPVLQIGEHKYGKPVPGRVVKPAPPLGDAEKAGFLSMDSTLRSNLSVGMPLDLSVIERDVCRVSRSRRVEAGDEAFRAMSDA